MLRGAAVAAANTIAGPGDGRHRSLEGSLTTFIEDCRQRGPASGVGQLQARGPVASCGDATEKVELILQERLVSNSRHQVEYTPRSRHQAHT